MANTESAVQIIPYYSQPHVFTRINDNTVYDETTAPRISPDDLPYSTVVVTGADQGIDNTFVRLSDIKTKNEIFGKSNFQKYGQSSIQADVLFNGSTNVWFCRVLPNNATYANVVVLAHYRVGKVLDDLGQETGMKRLEIKFSTAYANKPYIVEGARNTDDIEIFANSLVSNTPDPQTGYMTVPLLYVRSTGRGKYGNNYSIAITRDTDAEKEYNMKMYAFNLLSNKDSTRVLKRFSGSIYQTTRYDMSTLIEDVLDQYATGSCPINIHTFESSLSTLFETYQSVVAANLAYIQTAGATADELNELKLASSITEESFDPIFGYVLNTNTGDTIPYYRNYTTKASGAYKAPDLEIPSEGGGTKPLNLSSWASAFVGARVLVAADPLNEGHRWLYTVTGLDTETGNIVYDEGVPCDIDEDQYTGINVAQSIGHRLDGGHDGDFQEITVNGETRAPSGAEMKLLLSREFVKAFRGEKDNKILSPARMDIDFIFDANYNMTSDESLTVDTDTAPLYNFSTVLTDKDSQVLATTGNASVIVDYSDLNVKKAMFDLNEFRNKNGMKIDPERGAGCSLYLDCNTVGLKAIGVNYELLNIINMMEEMEGRGASIDLGYYEIFDPVSKKRITVTVDYYIAKNLIPHLVRYGMNEPFVYKKAQIRAIQKDTSLTVSGDMIRDTFRPAIDLIDWDVKERLYKSRINYWITSEEGRVVERACQNTRQLEASALLEENNVRVLNALKKGLDEDCRGFLYSWNEPEARKAYTDIEMKKYESWKGTFVQDLNIRFEANQWEQGRMVMHCYCDVSFRDIAKRIVLEININRPNYSSSEGGES